LLTNAAKKLASKHADLVAANDITQPDAGFGSAQNRVTLLRRTALEQPVVLPLLDKPEVARRLLAEVAALLAG
jgi:phosphopantothenoylcysteine decarboxylase/phosphopantothenate--cysteine ligase